MATLLTEPETWLDQPPPDGLWEYIDGKYVEKYVGAAQSMWRVISYLHSSHS